MARPKEFDQTEALARAMETFWRKGYEGASIGELEAEMEIGRGSIYLTFGDKHRLFVSALEAYCDRAVRCFAEALDGATSTREGLAEFFRLRMSETAESDDTKGCLLTNTITELAPHDEEVAAITNGTLARLEDLLYRSFVRDRKAGRLAEGKSPRALARYVLNNIEGLTVLYKAGMGRPALRQVIEVMLESLPVS